MIGTLVGAGALGSLDDPFLILRDGNGTFIDQDGTDDGSSFTARLSFTPTESGIYYLEVRTFGSGGGRYFLDTLPEERTEDDPLPVGAQSLQAANSEGYVSGADPAGSLLSFDQVQLDIY